MSQTIVKMFKERKVLTVTGETAAILKRYLIDPPEGETNGHTWVDKSVKGQTIVEMWTSDWW